MKTMTFIKVVVKSVIKRVDYPHRAWFSMCSWASEHVNCFFSTSFFQMDVYKQPVTDPSKGSKKGRLSLRRNSDGFIETIERGAGKPEEVGPNFHFKESIK